jgi:hypothetical protein
MSSVSQFFGGGRIKNIQRGVISITEKKRNDPFNGIQDITINAVDTTKSILYHLGSPSNSDLEGNFYWNYYFGGIKVMLTLENSTTIRADVGIPLSDYYYYYGLGYQYAQVSWQLVEYF